MSWFINLNCLPEPAPVISIGRQDSIHWHRFLFLLLCCLEREECGSVGLGTLLPVDLLSDVWIKHQDGGTLAWNVKSYNWSIPLIEVLPYIQCLRRCPMMIDEILKLHTTTNKPSSILSFVSEDVSNQRITLWTRNVFISQSFLCLGPTVDQWSSQFCCHVEYWSDCSDQFLALRHLTYLLITLRNKSCLMKDYEPS